jgi:hypothetical protein
MVDCKSWAKIASRNVGITQTRLPMPSTSSSHGWRAQAATAASAVPTQVPKTIDTSTSSTEATAALDTWAIRFASKAEGVGRRTASACPRSTSSHVTTRMPLTWSPSVIMTRPTGATCGRHTVTSPNASARVKLIRPRLTHSTVGLFSNLFPSQLAGEGTVRALRYRRAGMTSCAKVRIPGTKSATVAPK